MKGKVLFMQQEDFVFTGSGDFHGILKQVGERDVVVNYRFLEGADEADNEWLQNQLMIVYQQYYYRVKSYNPKV